MGAGLEKTKRRIASISSTKKITKAMEMIASVKLLKCKKETEGLSYSYKAAEDIVYYLASYLPESHPVFSSHGGVPLHIVIASDLGLCGAYNSSLFKEADSLIGQDDLILPIGGKADNRYSEAKGYKVLPPLDLSSKRCLLTRLNELKDGFLEGKYSSIDIVYTEYVNSLTFLPKVRPLLPLTKLPTPFEVKPLMNPNEQGLFEYGLPLYLELALSYSLAESSLSEQNSRRNAMETANDNADELLAKLHIQFNKARQTAITQEIIEVVSGSVNQ